MIIEETLNVLLEGVRRSMDAALAHAPLWRHRHHGEQRLRAVHRLNLRLFVYAEHASIVRWENVQVDNIAHL